MLGLCFETCFKAASASLLLQNGEVKTLSEVREARQSESLSVMVEAILKENGVKPQELEFVLCNKGPGSFTGVRIGLSFMEGLTFGLPSVKKLYLNSFGCILGGLPAGLTLKKNLLVVIHAIRGTFYIAKFSPDCREISSPEYVTLEAIKALLQQEDLEVFGEFAGFEKEFSIAGSIIAYNAQINSTNMMIAMKRFPHLVTTEGTPFYLRASINSSASANSSIK